jgi:hypothetical protein
MIDVFGASFQNPGDYVAVVRGLRDRAVVTAFELNLADPRCPECLAAAWRNIG